MSVVRVQLVDENDKLIVTVETDYATVGEVGIIEREGEFFTYRQQRGQFFTIPVFQRVKVAHL